MQLQPWTLIGRLCLAALLGGTLGFERELSGHGAGLRTHILVSLGACLFVLAGTFGLPLLEAGHSQVTRADISRVASNVVVGIGFLGGGTILRKGWFIRGLTTAASLWVAAALGLACALGFYLGAIVTAAIVLLSLVGLGRIEPWIARRGERDRKGRPPD